MRECAVGGFLLLLLFLLPQPSARAFRHIRTDACTLLYSWGTRDFHALPLRCHCARGPASQPPGSTPLSLFPGHHRQARAPNFPLSPGPR